LIKFVISYNRYVSTITIILMDQLTLGLLDKSKVKTIAENSTGFSIDLILKIGRDDISQLIEVSEELVQKFGPMARLTKSNITKYFNKETLPFVARQNGKIIGYIIGVPLEYFKNESWAHFDVNLGSQNTIYTYAFVISSRFHKKGGYAKTLKRVYINSARKQKFTFVTGHTELGIAKNFSPKTETVKIFSEWYGSKVSFEYYRRPLN